uniref:PHB domain-containing protein n=1 Tax=Parastrongyloides trichosuri TaxID=131310 RepID=A0A0N4ZLR7_PARTI
MNNEVPVTKTSLCSYIVIFFSYVLIILTFPLTIWTCFRVIKEYERAIIFRLGRIVDGEKGPGLFFINSFIEKCIVLDLRVFSFVVPTQEILSKDSVTVNIDAVVYFQIVDVIKTVNNVNNYEESTKLLAQTTLRNITGTKTLSELLSYKENISKQLQEVLAEATQDWGVKVHRVELRDVCIPQSMQKAMAAEGEATREAKAKVIAADGEKEASKALTEAADILSSNPNAIKLRYLQTLNNIGSDQNTTIIFPVDILQNIFQNKNNDM